MARLRDAELRSFTRSYGTVGGSERRTVALAEPSARVSGGGDGRLHVKGHASVFNSPSVELQGRYGKFVETIQRHAFDEVLRTSPDVLLTWDHDTKFALARTTAGNL
jgi:phage head maturation protease